MLYIFFMASQVKGTDMKRWQYNLMWATNFLTLMNIYNLFYDSSSKNEVSKRLSDVKSQK